MDKNKSSIMKELNKKEQMKTKEEIVRYVYDMNLQNLTEKTSFDRAYKQGIKDTIDDLIELNLLTMPVVVSTSKCYHENHEWKSDGDGCSLKYCNDCKGYV